MKKAIYIFLFFFSSLAIAQDDFTQIKKLLASDGATNHYFGWSADIEGDFAVVGAYLADNLVGAAYIYKKNLGGSNNWGELKKLSPENGTYGNNFGYSVVIEGDVIAVSEFSEEQGAVYIYGKDVGGSDNWGLIKKLTPPAEDTDIIEFGQDIDLSGDYLIVGADDNGRRGKAYIYYRNNGGTDNWGKVQDLTESVYSGDQYGNKVAISGNIAIVSSPWWYDDNNIGKVYLYEKDHGGTDNWGKVTELSPKTEVGNEFFGSDIDVDGDYIIVSSTGRKPDGIVYVYNRDHGGTDNWGQTTVFNNSNINAVEGFGNSISISGLNIVVSGWGYHAGNISDAGIVRTFQIDTNNHNVIYRKSILVNPEPFVNDWFGAAVALDGNTLISTAYNDDDNGQSSGSAYIFEDYSVVAEEINNSRNDNEWYFKAYDIFNWTDETYPVDVATNSEGFTYVLGTIREQGAGFGNEKFSYMAETNVPSDMYLLKLNSSGDINWVKTFGGENNGEPVAMALDRTGNIVITGYFRSQIDLSTNDTPALLTPSANDDIFFAKYDEDGNLLWAESIESEQSSQPKDIVVDYNNEIIIAGFYAGVTDFDPSEADFTAASINNTQDPFFAKYDENGNNIWVSRINSAGVTEAVNGIDVDYTNNVYVVGIIANSNADLNPREGEHLVNVNGKDDTFFGKYTSEGELVWAHAMGGINFEHGHDISTDAVGNVYVVGDFNSEFDLDPSAGEFLVNPENYYDIFSATYNSVGEFVRGFTIPSNFFTENPKIESDHLGNQYIIGEFAGTADFDPSVEVYNISTNTTTYDVFYSKYDTTGNLVWAKSVIGASSNDSRAEIELDDFGNYYVVGQAATTSTLIFNMDSPDTTDGQDHMFVIKHHDDEFIPNPNTPNETEDDVITVSIDSTLYLFDNPGDSPAQDYWELTVPVKVNLASGLNFSAFEFEIGQPHENVEITGISNIYNHSGTPQSTWVYETNVTDSVVYFAGADFLDLSGEFDATFFNLNIRVSHDFTEGSYPIEIRKAYFDDGKASEISNGILRMFIPDYGDVDGNERIEAFDASHILRYAALDSGLTEKQQFNADVSKDGTVSALDASKVLQYIVKLINELPDTSSIEAQGSVSFAEQLFTKSNEINLPLLISGAENVYSFEGEFKFNMNELEITSVTKSIGLEEVNFIYEVLDDGTVKFAAASKTPVSGNLELVTINLIPKSGFSGSKSVIELNELRINENDILFGVDTAEVSLVTSVNENTSIPEEYSLSQNYPNPFNPATTINFALPVSGNVTLIVYNVLGEHVSNLINGKQLNAGYHSVNFNASKLASGIYYYRIQSGSYSQTKKMILLK